MSSTFISSAFVLFVQCVVMILLISVFGFYSQHWHPRSHQPSVVFVQRTSWTNSRLQHIPTTWLQDWGACKWPWNCVSYSAKWTVTDYNNYPTCSTTSKFIVCFSESAFIYISRLVFEVWFFCNVLKSNSCFACTLCCSAAGLSSFVVLANMLGCNSIVDFSWRGSVTFTWKVIFIKLLSLFDGN